MFKMSASGTYAYKSFVWVVNYHKLPRWSSEQHVSSTLVSLYSFCEYLSG